MCSVIRAHVKQVILHHHMDDVIINRNQYSYRKPVYVSNLCNHYKCILSLVQSV